MRLYEGSTREFIELTTQNRISDRVSQAYLGYYHRNAGASEVTSWTNSLQFLKNVIEANSLLDNMVVLEFELPYVSQRIDAMLFGKGSDSGDNVVVIELKQWSKVEPSRFDGNVVTFVGNAPRDVPHPSIQVKGYHSLLKDFMEMFSDGSTNLHSCAYCHNYSKSNEAILFSTTFSEVLKEFPLFSKEDFESIGSYLKQWLSQGSGIEIFNRFVTSPIGPSKKLLDNASRVIKGQPAFTLVDEQIVANNAILDRAKKASKAKGKSVIIVKGGPGTGKSVIALNVLAELAAKGQKVFHATGSKSFTTALQRAVGTRAAALFSYFNNYTEARVGENAIDVLICDEAHRIRTSSNSRFTRRDQRSTLPQVEELVRAAKVCVFFIDDAQVVRPVEVGSTDLILESAAKWGAEVFTFELKTQFRCGGSDGYLDWVDNLLGVRENDHDVLRQADRMEFKVDDSPGKVLEFIKQKNQEKPNSARMVAGFCWEWSKQANPDGTLVNDIVIGDFRIPWEGRDDDPLLSKEIPKWYEWAYNPRGVDQCGSIYTIQGFEFEYVGLIFGKDYVYDPDSRRWRGRMDESKDPFVTRNTKTEEEFTRYVRNIYRVLMTRGMKGCHVYFMDKATESYVRNRLEL